jgi:cysteine desulfurase
MTRPIYLDYNGTTPHAPEVIAAMRPFLEQEFGNPSSSHWYGIIPKQAVEKARRQVAALLNCEPDELVFTSGGTESNNHAIKGMATALMGKGNHIITASIEHPAVLEVCRALAPYGIETSCLPVDRYGLVDPAEVEKAIRPETILISIMHSNNEVGTLQPIAEISAMARRRGIAMHTDAAQSVGKVAVDVRALGVDLLSVAGHKLYAPKGVGALYIRRSVQPAKFCHGAGQERGWRAGTENVLEIVGLGMACEIAGRDLEKNIRQMQGLRDRLHQGLLADLGPGVCVLNGHPEKRLPNTLSLGFRGLAATRILEEIGLEVAASPGAACHSDKVEISHVLQAMGIDRQWAMGTLRFSLGRTTTLAEIDRTRAVVTAAVRKLGG